LHWFGERHAGLNCSLRIWPCIETFDKNVCFAFNISCEEFSWLKSISAIGIRITQDKLKGVVICWVPSKPMQSNHPSFDLDAHMPAN